MNERTHIAQQPVAPFVHHPACPKPEPRNYCKCGANRGCRTCGWGCGQIPCSCSPARNLGNGMVIA